MGMKEVFIIGDNIVSPVGLTSLENFNRLTQLTSGIRIHENKLMAAEPFYASLFGDDEFPGDPQQEGYSRFEQMLLRSVSDALMLSGLDPVDKKLIFILSTTKGNISLLETGCAELINKKRLSLPESAATIASYFRFHHTPLVVSHACISGMVAAITGLRLIRSGLYDHAVVAGADEISRFILSGFQSFQAVSPVPCKPFDAKRNGITLGEAAGTLILSSSRKKNGPAIKFEGGSVSNDANHISGPSRTGMELCDTIQKTMKEAGVRAGQIDFISAHGTATVYNDEMEARALTLAGLQEIPLNSLKGYYGHTLGAAGLIESIVSIHTLRESVLLPTFGFHEPGTTKPIHVVNKLQKGSFRRFLKTGSGFGGCNASMLLSRE